MFQFVNKLMLSMCSNLTTLDLQSFNTSSVTNMGDMFNGCTSLPNFNSGYVDVSMAKPTT